MSKEIVMELNDISKIYGLNGVKVKALEKVNLELYKGEVVIIMGPSGAGKTTLLSIMGFLLHPSTGTIKFNGSTYDKDSKQKTLTKIRRNSIGFIFQAFNLIKSLSVIENLELMAKISKDNKNGYQKKCESILDILNMGDRKKHKPKHLSGGELQRVSIARALINEPPIIFADEPTGNLDSNNGHIIGEYFRKIAKERGTSILCATHDQRLEFCADRIIHIEDGKLID